MRGRLSEVRPERRTLLACLALAYLTFALFYAWVLVNHDYESEYLALGNLVVRGELSLYQDEMRGQWVPLPFYFYGLSQVLFGPSLLAGRLIAVALGAIVVGLVFTIATRWSGPLGGAAACALFCTQGLVMGYFSTVHFAGLVAALHLLGIYVLFCTRWPRRDLAAMAIVSMLFLVKPNYWPTIPFVLAFVLWHASSARRRVALVAVALVIPLLFFAWDRNHLKMLAYVPVLRNWVEPLGYSSWYSLTEDAGQVAQSDYADIPWDPSFSGRIVPTLKGFLFLLRRYAVWAALLAALVVLTAWLARVRRARELWEPPGVRFTFWLFWYVVAFQFVIMGPYAKQAVGFVGAVAPLLAVVIGCLFATVVSQSALPGTVRTTALACLVLAVIVSPWVHRHHNLPRTIALADAPIPALRKVADRLAAVIPAGETRVFSVADPMPVHLAGRRTYLQQFNQHMFVFTSLRDRARYVRVGMWGPTELEEWLGADARYAILSTDVVESYRRRERYREIMTRMDSLLAQKFVPIATIPELAGDRLLVYRRKEPATAGVGAPAATGAR
ncbi:MAG: hypothetical protein DMD96_09750 [Candidatus Rokuibacteriota bacterium]|nr:MAG: hypothetical protein DMD96_09750 [Candidatus Rokubacteria bacterium]